MYVTDHIQSLSPDHQYLNVIADKKLNQIIKGKYKTQY
jgi:hypothetical protein